MTTLDPEVLEQARQFSERVSSSLGDAERAKLIDFARPIAKALVQECGSERAALRVAGTMSTVIAGLLTRPLVDAVDTMTDTSAGYALAVGIIAGVIDAPEPAAEQEAEPESVLAGPYL